MAYYYLISSLPELYAHESLPIDWEEFLARCENAVPAKTFKELRALGVQGSDANPFLRKWKRFYSDLQSRITVERLRRNTSVSAEGAEKDAELDALVSQAVGCAYGEDGIGDPLEAEKLLLSFLLKKADELSGTSKFDEDELFSYAIKLKLLQRCALFTSEAGFGEYKRLSDSLKNEIFGTGDTYGEH